jgi:hypothetical protein
MARFDSGANPSVRDTLVEHSSKILLSPIFTLVERSDIAAALLPGLLSYLAVLANSALWAVVSWWLIRLPGRLRTQQRTAAAQPSPSLGHTPGTSRATEERYRQ